MYDMSSTLRFFVPKLEVLNGRTLSSLNRQSWNLVGLALWYCRVYHGALQDFRMACFQYKQPDQGFMYAVSSVVLDISC